MSDKKAYAFKPRVSFPIDAQTAGEALDKIRGHNSGELTPEAVVDAAKDKNSPLHKVFEWDDGKAGYQFRLQQANSLIRAVIVTVTKEQASSAPMSVSVSESSKPASTASVVSAEELHKQRVDRGWADLASWQKTYGGLPEFAGVTAALTGFFAMRAGNQKAA